MYAQELKFEPLLMQAATDLARRDILSLEPLGTGGNNRIYRVHTRDGQVFALKTYMHVDDDPRDRMGAECKAMAFVWAQGLRCIPRLIGADRQRGCALFDWVDGERVATPTAADLDAAARFLGELKSLSTLATARMIPMASEACLSAAELYRQIRQRQVRLMEVDNLGLSRFLEGPFGDALEQAERRARADYGAAALDFSASLERERWTLSPSDFGFHNALRIADGSLIFVDFEYFGWDDPVKLVADFLLHPGMSLSGEQQQTFRKAASPLFEDDASFVTRLGLLHPLYALRWNLILLNEFLPERWERKLYANPTLDRAMVQERQLKKAQSMLARAISELEESNR